MGRIPASYKQGANMDLKKTWYQKIFGLKHFAKPAKIDPEAIAYIAINALVGPAETIVKLIYNSQTGEGPVIHVDTTHHQRKEASYSIEIVRFPVNKEDTDVVRIYDGKLDHRQVYEAYHTKSEKFLGSWKVFGMENIEFREQ
jgi:hypothetical protein